MKFLTIVLITILFSRCLFTKREIQVDCRDGKIYLSTWQANVLNQNDNIKYPENAKLQRSLYLTDNNKPINCN